MKHISYLLYYFIIRCHSDKFLISENQKVEILSLLREYSIIDTYSDLSLNSDVKDDIVVDDIDITIDNNSDINVSSMDFGESNATDIKVDTNSIEINNSAADINVEVPPFFEENIEDIKVKDTASNDVKLEEIKDNAKYIENITRKKKKLSIISR